MQEHSFFPDQQLVSNIHELYGLWLRRHRNSTCRSAATFHGMVVKLLTPSGSSTYQAHLRSYVWFQMI